MSENSPARGHKPNSLSMKRLLSMTVRERGQEGGRSRLGSQLLEAPGLCWISVGFSMQGPGHPKASKCVPGLALPKAPCSSPSTEQIVPCSAELIECRKFLRLPPAPN